MSVLSLTPTLKMTRPRVGNWQAPIIGAIIGLTYGVVSQTLDFEMLRNPQIARNPHPWLFIDTVVSVILPGVAGILAGLISNHVRWQAKMNQVLSAESLKLRRHLLTQALSSHILHEIRNPIHNVTAVLDSWRQRFPVEEAAILQRNLVRLQAVASQLSRWTMLDDNIDLRESVRFRPWFNEFITDKVRSQLHQANINLHPTIGDVVVQMHPLLLEQCLISLINNAMEAASRGNGARTIVFSATVSPQDPRRVHLCIRNTGAAYPDGVLVSQGRGPVESQYGLGFGLVLARKTLELVGGSLTVANEDGQASTTLWIPGARA